MISKIVMNYLYPNPSPYEIINSENMIFILFNTIFSMENNLKKHKYSMNHETEQLEQELNKYRYQLKFFNYFMIVILIFFIFSLKQYLIKNEIILISMK